MNNDIENLAGARRNSLRTC